MPRAVLEKLARGEKRALLSLATGTGKTRIAVNLLKRIGDAGQLRRGRASEPGARRVPERALRGLLSPPRRPHRQRAELDGGERKAIDEKSYDLKAVNPHARNDEDLRTPEELMDLIEAKGKEVAEAIVVLRGLTTSRGE